MALALLPNEILTGILAPLNYGTLYNVAPSIISVSAASSAGFMAIYSFEHLESMRERFGICRTSLVKERFGNLRKNC
jgi:hypothetical protein